MYTFFAACKMVEFLDKDNARINAKTHDRLASFRHAEVPITGRHWSKYEIEVGFITPRRFINL